MRKAGIEQFLKLLHVQVATAQMKLMLVPPQRIPGLTVPTVPVLNSTFNHFPLLL